MTLKGILYELSCGSTLHLEYSAFVRVGSVGDVFELQAVGDKRTSLADILTSPTIKVFNSYDRADYPLIGLDSAGKHYEIWNVYPFTFAPYCDKNHEPLLNLVEIRSNIRRGH